MLQLNLHISIKTPVVFPLIGQSHQLISILKQPPSEELGKHDQFALFYTNPPFFLDYLTYLLGHKPAFFY